jgi:serine/threonine protein phosphatase PrpC
MPDSENAEAADGGVEAPAAAPETRDREVPAEAKGSAVPDMVSEPARGGDEPAPAHAGAAGKPGNADGAADGASTVASTARKPHRRDRSVIEFAPPTDQSAQRADAAAAAVDPRRIRHPLTLVGDSLRGSVPQALPHVAEPAPDAVVDGGIAGGLIARAASIRGDDHRCAGEGRQDSIGLWALHGEQDAPGDGAVLLAAVADGVGSRALSHLGSAAACRLLRRHVTTRLAALLEPEQTAALTDACRRTLGDIAEGLRAEAAERAVAHDQLATTLVAALVVPATRDHPARATVFAVGDSTASVLRAGTWHACLPAVADAQGGRMADTRTDALPMHADRVTFTVTTLEPGDVLLLSTDGLAGPMLNESVRDQLADWWGDGRVPSLPEFHWQMSFGAYTFGDDRSAVCVWVP